tara:strand:- start:864 stop:1013 length:150 start_codon:yes stop_codon:yes gene_type:complete
VTSPDLYGDAPPVAESVELRCSKCDKLLAEMITAPFRILCQRCREINHA